MAVCVIQVVFTACDSCYDSVCHNEDTLSRIDTVFIYDSTYVFDSLFFNDTSVFIDTIFSKETLFSSDTIVINDTVYSKDTILLKDSIYLKDSTFVKDSVFFIDTIYAKDKIVFIPEKDDDIAGFSHFSHDVGNISEGEINSFLDAHIKKNILLLFRINGNVDRVLCGVSYLGFYGKWVEITQDSLIFMSGQKGTVEESFAHGLTLGKKVSLTIDKDEKSGVATVRLYNDKGDFYSCDVKWMSIVGPSFIRNESDLYDINGYISFTPRDIQKSIWLFGDSYLDYYSTARWPYYIIRVYGFNNMLLDARGGESSGEALADLNRLLSISKPPVFIVWTLGMNDASDSKDAPATKWKNVVDSVVSICEKKNITPVFTLLPSIPSKDHSQKNLYLRSLGVRLIDLESAVSESGSLNWKWTGTEDAFLSSDNVHPTSKGAAAMAEQVLKDFPEIAVGN